MVLSLFATQGTIASLPAPLMGHASVFPVLWIPLTFQIIVMILVELVIVNLFTFRSQEKIVLSTVKVSLIVKYFLWLINLKC